MKVKRPYPQLNFEDGVFRYVICFVSLMKDCSHGVQDFLLSHNVRTERKSDSVYGPLLLKLLLYEVEKYVDITSK